MNEPAKNTARYDMLVVTGPTASGKTSLAARLAHGLGGDVISADSSKFTGRWILARGRISMITLLTG